MSFLSSLLGSRSELDLAVYNPHAVRTAFAADRTALHTFLDRYNAPPMEEFPKKAQEARFEQETSEETVELTQAELVPDKQFETERRQRWEEVERRCTSAAGITDQKSRLGHFKGNLNQQGLQKR